MKNKSQNSKRTAYRPKEKGVSLLFVVLIMSMILATGLGVSSILTQQTKTISQIGHSVVSFYTADAGIEQQLYDLYKAPPGEHHSNFSGVEVSKDAFYNVRAKCSSNLSMEECPAGFETDANCSAPNYCVKSVGQYKEMKRAIEIKY